VKFVSNILILCFVLNIIILSQNEINFERYSLEDGFREALLNAKTSEEIYEIFNEEEKKYFELT